MRENVDLDEYNNIEIINRKLPDVPPEKYLPYQPDETGVVRLVPFANEQGYRYVINGMHHPANGMPNLSTAAIQESIDRINNKIDNNQEDIWQWEEFGIEDAEILVVACGCVSRSAIEAVNICRAKGIKIGMFRPITIWPFLSDPLEKALKNVNTVIVPEMNKGQYVHKIKELVSKDINVVQLNVYDGSLIMPEQIMAVIEEVSGK
jgi:2-oxoglutarate ferredoxin oxidoreductase subunit alpha